MKTDNPFRLEVHTGGDWYIAYLGKPYPPLSDISWTNIEAAKKYAASLNHVWSLGYAAGATGGAA